MNSPTQLCQLADNIREQLSILSGHSMANRYDLAAEAFDKIMGYTGDIKRIAHQEGSNNDYY